MIIFLGSDNHDNHDIVMIFSHDIFSFCIKYLKLLNYYNFQNLCKNNDQWGHILKHIKV